MAVRQQCLVTGTETSRLRAGETTTLWAAIPSIPMFERCSRKLEGRKQQKGVVIRTSRLMIDATFGTLEPLEQWNLPSGTEPGL